jgi:hypothetical protein
LIATLGFIRLVDEDTIGFFQTGLRTNLLQLQPPFLKSSLPLPLMLFLARKGIFGESSGGGLQIKGDISH